MTMIKLCKKSDVPENGMKGFSINGEKVFVANVSGKYYVNSSECTHRGAPMEDGMLDDNIATCPWHGGQFDVTTGNNLSPPSPSPLKHFKSEIKGDEIWIDVYSEPNKKSG